jgi:hypothetical protein
MPATLSPTPHKPTEPCSTGHGLFGMCVDGEKPVFFVKNIEKSNSCRIIATGNRQQATGNRQQATGNKGIGITLSFSPLL